MVGEVDTSKLSDVGVIKVDSTQIGELGLMIAKHCYICSAGCPEFQLHDTDGEVRVFNVTCRTCERSMGRWTTLPGKVETDCGTFYTANIRLVAGCLATANGFEDVKKLHAWQNIRTMTSDFFRKLTHFWGQNLMKHAEISMNAAAAEEAERALALGRMFTDAEGKKWPATGAIIDGGYSEADKGTQRHRAKAMNEVAIGEITGKVIDSIVMQKSCATCHKFSKEGKEALPEDHPHGHCYKNMDFRDSIGHGETLSAVRIFTEAPTKRGLAFTKRIGDSDASTYGAIVSTCAFYRGEVENAICINHNGKNLFYKLTVGIADAMKEKFPKWKPEELGLTKQKAIELCCGVRGTLKHYHGPWKAATSNMQRAEEVQKCSEELKTNWTHYAPNVFNHIYCKNWFCKMAKHRNDREVQVRHAPHPAVLRTFSSIQSVPVQEQPVSAVQNDDDADFIKLLDTAIDAGLIDRNVLDAEMRELRATMDQFDSNLLRKVAQGEETVVITKAGGKRVTVLPKREPAQLYLWSLVEKVLFFHKGSCSL